MARTVVPAPSTTSLSVNRGLIETANNTIFAAVYDEPAKVLYIGGSFTSIDKRNQHLTNFASYNPTTAAVTLKTDVIVNGAINAVAADGNGGAGCCGGGAARRFGGGQARGLCALPQG